MPMPTRDMIRDRALELYYADKPEAVGLPVEDDELKEGNYWRRAQLQLMRGWSAEIGMSVQEAVEKRELATEEYLRYIEGEVKRLEAMITELEEAAPPPIPIPFKETLWIAFSDILHTATISPELHREAFEAEYEAVKGRSEAEQRRAIMELAKDIVRIKPPPVKPPVYPSPDEVIALFLAGRLNYEQYQEMMIEAFRRRKVGE